MDGSSGTQASKRAVLAGAHASPADTSMSSGSKGASEAVGGDPEAFKRDPKYKRYVNAIDSILKLFDSVNEWADVIGFLSKLLKARIRH
ncbi:hypothetical protein HDU84_002088 [Entophlyctis sp. JEL0112]|nr:hypothetical protein HDU84_002088 [Entophlyctis sp. JEL0112]